MVVLHTTHYRHSLTVQRTCDIIKWKNFPLYWPFVQGIHRSSVNSPHRRQWCWALMFSLICAWTSGWANTWDASYLIPLHSLWRHCNGNGYLQHWMARASLNDVFQGIFRKKNMGIEFTAKFITTEPLTFFNKSSPGDLSATTIGTSMSWVTCFIVRRAGLLWSQQDFEWRWSVPLFKCLTVLEFSFILFDLCLLITFFNFIMNYVPIVTFWIFTYHKIWILSIMFCSIWSYWIIYFLACLEVSWRVVS